MRRAPKQTRQPTDDLGGLSPEQYKALLSGDWRERGPLRFRPPPADVAAATVVCVNARRLLEAIDEVGSAAATPEADLDPAFVRHLVPRLWWPGHAPAEPDRVVTGERDESLHALHLQRQALVASALLELGENGYRVSGAGRRLCEPTHASQLYEILFRTYFRDMRRSPGAWIRPPVAVWRHVPYVLWVLHELPPRWDPLASAGPLLPEHVWDGLAGRSLLECGPLLMVRVLDQLVDFGLLAYRAKRSSARGGVGGCGFRRTARYRRCIRFRFEGDPPTCTAWGLRLVT